MVGFALQRDPETGAPDRAATNRVTMALPRRSAPPDVPGLRVGAVDDPMERLADGRQSRIHRSTTRAAFAGNTRQFPGTTAVDGLATRIRAASHRAVAASIQRWVNEDFGEYEVIGVPTKQQLQQARAFAKKVSDFAEQAVGELLRGDLDSWGTTGRYNAKGPRFLAFVDLLARDNPMACTHVGNAVEDRVYQLMAGTDMGFTWYSQKYFGTSRPDIAVEFPDGRFAAIDVTSDIAHVTGKPGLWSTSQIVYVGEAVFDSVARTLLAGSKEAILGGEKMDEEGLAANREEADAQAEAKKNERDERRIEATELWDRYGTMRAFADGEFDGSLAAASDYLRARGVKRKGMTRKTGKQRSALDMVAGTKKSAAAAKTKRAAKKRALVRVNRPGIREGEDEGEGEG